MNADRELLEAAAKAADMHWLIWTPGMAPVVPPAFRVPGDRACWAPLTDDGDAFRLAVRLNLALEVSSRVAIAWLRVTPTGSNLVDRAEEINGDAYAATRRAIVRAAAAIGAAK